MSIMGYRKGIPPSPPPRGGGGGGGEARSVPRGWHDICWEQVPCQVRAKIKKRFLRFFSTSCEDFKCKRQVHARKKVKKNIRKMWTNLSLSSNLWAWKTKSNGRIWWTSKLTVALQRWLTSQAHSARC